MAQHSYGDEVGWWQEHGVKDPFALAEQYYARYLTEGGSPEYLPRKRTTIKPRLPREKRTKIKGRSTWGQRKLRNRK